MSAAGMVPAKKRMKKGQNGPCCKAKIRAFAIKIN